MKKFIALTIISFSLVVNLLPFIPTGECDMMCCMPEPSCCEIEKIECSVYMTQCETAIFVPMISAPLTKYQLQKDLSLVRMSVVHQVPVTAAVHESYLAQIPEAEPPPSFLFPLLI
ncbi:MAG: hypothetical protein CMG27_01445 [Candidatus Marinimicrobia bacterium]|jgi:hypothetical protein|nr:hypothetical protein [Candidatus Neomarinimicrobiota bacterium]